MVLCAAPHVETDELRQKTDSMRIVVVEVCQTPARALSIRKIVGSGVAWDRRLRLELHAVHS